MCVPKKKKTDPTEIQRGSRDINQVATVPGSPQAPNGIIMIEKKITGPFDGNHVATG